MRSIIYFLIFLSFLLSGCSGQTKIEQEQYTDLEDIELWIVSEKSVSDGMNSQTDALIQFFENAHPNVTLKLDILPTDSSREKYLKELTSLMNTGAGPDIFLLPSSDVLTLEYPVKYTYTKITPLFPDVNIAMRHGYFKDISVYYNSDSMLNTCELDENLMRAGVVNNRRYTLPLRYTAPVMYVCEDCIGKHTDISSLYLGIDTWMKYILRKDDPVLGCSADFVSLDAFSNIIDYEKKDVILSHKTIIDYFTQLQKIQTLIGTEYRHRTNANIESYTFGKYTHFPAQVGTLGYALDHIAISKAENHRLSLHPIRTTEGDWVATITYFAAIGANCMYPETAYEFIRLFLSEESQHDELKISSTSDQWYGLLMDSWPVRKNDSAEILWNDRKNQINTWSGNTISAVQRKKAIQNVCISDTDMPILNIDIDISRYPAYLPKTLSYYSSKLNDANNNFQPTDVNIDDLAYMVINDLSEHLK